MKQFMRVVALAATFAACLIAATAASAATAPGYEEFGDCPDRAADPAVGGCVITEVNSGHLKLGTKNTPIEDQIRLVLGLTNEGQSVPGSFDGGRQRIPGGLIGITGLDWLRFLFPFSALQIYAEAELAGPVTNALDAPALPLKVRLDNVLLNNNCYIGSNGNPIQLNLTTGTTSPPPPNTPISGQPGTIGLDPVLPGVVRSTGIRYVDNAFAAPAATNCDLLALNLLVTALVNLQAGLPAAAGNNETVQNANVSIAPIELIYPPNGIE
jgi:hypothetical protein